MNHNRVFIRLFPWTILCVTFTFYIKQKYKDTRYFTWLWYVVIFLEIHFDEIIDQLIILVLFNSQKERTGPFQGDLFLF